jgi:hypothetical protein
MLIRDKVPPYLYKGVVKMFLDDTLFIVFFWGGILYVHHLLQTI